MDPNIYTKKDDNTLTVVEVILEKTIPKETKPAKDFNYSFLLKQVIEIQKQWDEQLAQKQAEITKINTKRQEEKDFVEKLIAKAVKLGLKEDVVLPINP